MALYPHMYSQMILEKKAANGQRDNANPRGVFTLKFYRICCPAPLYAKVERAESCHQNHMENAPFFVGAILAGNLTGLVVPTMNGMVGAYLSLCLLYSFLYVKIETTKPSYARSGIWAAGVAVLMMMFAKAGNKMNGSLGL